eukprot:GHVT01019925.1.p1 GENE.GHVT01019925.1~~GHVT01019925.1.p1  ORF type:complete len:146 (+),score=39.82 GHVT01019925.1:290-727(+)
MWPILLAPTLGAGSLRPNRRPQLEDRLLLTGWLFALWPLVVAAVAAVSAVTVAAAAAAPAVTAAAVAAVPAVTVAAVPAVTVGAGAAVSVAAVTAVGFAPVAASRPICSVPPRARLRVFRLLAFCPCLAWPSCALAHRTAFRPSR